MNIDFRNFSKSDLDKLLSKSKLGDAQSFNTLSKYVRDITYSYFHSKYQLGKIVNLDDVNDLTNNAYLTFAEQYHGINNLENWLRRVLFLSFVNWYKKKKKLQTFELQENYYITDEDKNIGNQIDIDRILKLLNTLTEQKQKILQMRFWQGLKFSEIAENLGKKESAIKKMFYRTIEELKNKLE